MLAIDSAAELDMACTEHWIRCR